MEPEYEDADNEVDYSDESFETSFEEEPVEPMKFADEFREHRKKPVEMIVPNLPSAFTDLGGMERKKLGFP